MTAAVEPDQPPPLRIYRWDLDKTYLKTEFDTVRQLMRTAFQSAQEKVAVPGASALIRELKANGRGRLCFISGSPRQMRRVLEEKLRLDGVEWDEFVLKDNLKNLLRGRFRAVREQVGYKLPVLLSSRAASAPEAQEVLFGDDAEADAYVYSLYADLVARRVDESTLVQVLRLAGVYKDDAARAVESWRRISVADPVQRIIIHLDRLTPPAHFAPYGPRVVPVFNYFQAALVLMADGHLTAVQVIRIGVEMLQHAGYNLLTLGSSFQDLILRGFPLQGVASALLSAMEGPQAVLSVVRPIPDIVFAFIRRIAALGPAAPTSAAAPVDYLARIDDARPHR